MYFLPMYTTLLITNTSRRYDINNDKYPYYARTNISKSGPQFYNIQFYKNTYIFLFY